MEWTRLLFDFLARIAWPLLAVVAVLAFRRPVGLLLHALAGRVETDLVAAEVAGISATFRVPALDTKVIEAADEKQQEAGGDLDVGKAIVAGYVTALSAAFEEWYEGEAFEPAEPEGAHNAALLEWARGPGVALVTQYSMLKRLASLLATRGWHTEPPPEEAAFEEARHRTMLVRALRKVSARAKRQERREFRWRVAALHREAGPGERLDGSTQARKE
jgi:hypothetical protein